MLSSGNESNGNSNYQTVTSVLSAVSLLLMCGVFFNIEFFRFNAGQVSEFVFSPHFLFFVISSYLLTRKRLSDRFYNYAVLFLAVIYCLAFYGKFLDVFRMAGDNICQIAFWKTLFHKNLTGAIGASFTKPGQLLILGPLHMASQYFGPLVFKIGLSLVMAACIWSLVRIATDIGGRVAGAVVFPVVVWAFVFEFLEGSASIFLIPALFTGLWLYFYRPAYRNIGRFLLVLSIQFHIQTIAVLAAIWLLLLVKKDHKDLLRFSLWSALSVGVWAGVIFRIQGAMARLNSGAAAGYPGEPGNGIGYMLEVLLEGLKQQPYIRSLLVLGAIGMIGAIYYGYRMYLAVFASMIILVMNVVWLGGTFNLERYCSTLYAFSCAVGVATVVRYAGEIRSSGTLASKGCITFSILLLLVSLDFTSLNYNRVISATDYTRQTRHDYVAKAGNILSDPLIRKGARLMTEDDIIYSLVVMNVDYFSSLTALQYFNVAGEPARREILAATDYVWIALNNGHPYYYLFHQQLPQWETDPFRMLVRGILATNRPASLYGYRFLPLDRNENRLVLKVEADNGLRQ